MNNNNNNNIIYYADAVVEGHSPIPNDDSSLDIEQWNARILNTTLQSLQSGQTLVIGNNNKYHLMGGIIVENLTNVTIDLSGELVFSKRIAQWPRQHDNDGRVLECLQFNRPTNVTFTSTGGNRAAAILDGNGATWWGIPFIGYIQRVENRPRLLRVMHGVNLILENWLFLNSPYWTTLFDNVNGLIIRNVGIQVKRTKRQHTHSAMDLTAFNTDGLDVSGRNVHIYDCNIWNQDDIIAVKDNSHGDDISENMVFERINGSGLGLTIGSIGGASSRVRNITFRDSYIQDSVKGIYLKFRHSGIASIKDVLFENIILDRPQQYAIWTGPAQQADTINPCHANPCSLCWPYLPGAVCEGEAQGSYRNLTFRDITILDPQGGGGVFMGSKENPMENVLLDGVRILSCDDKNNNIPHTNYSETFPLLLPVSDRMEDSGYVILFQIGLLVIIATILSLLGYGYWILRRKGKQRACLVLFCTSTLFTTMVVVRLVYVTSMLSSTRNDYSVCEGITGGIAMGDTYPVPACFDDQTTTTSGELSCQVISSSNIWMNSILSAILILLFCSIIPILLFLLDGKRPQPQLYTTIPTTSENDDDDDDEIGLASPISSSSENESNE